MGEHISNLLIDTGTSVNSDAYIVVIYKTTEPLVYGNTYTISAYVEELECDDVTEPSLDIYMTEQSVGADSAMIPYNNLVVNGFGENKKLEPFVANDPFGANDGNGKFVLGDAPIDCYGYFNRCASDLIPYDPNTEYVLSYWSRLNKNSSSGKAWFALFPFDIDKKLIDCTMTPGLNEYTYKLAKDVEAGDEYIYFEDLTNWSTGRYEWIIAFYNYTDSTGYTYPVGTYTRNFIDYKTQSNLDKANNRIKLASPYSGVTIPKSTPVMQHKWRNRSPYYGQNGACTNHEWKHWTNLSIKQTDDVTLRVTKYLRLGFTFDSVADFAGVSLMPKGANCWSGGSLKGDIPGVQTLTFTYNQPNPDHIDPNHIRIYNTSNNDAKRKAVLRNVMLVKGDTPAAWAPAEGETLTADAGVDAMSSNLLNGISPTIKNGATKDGDVYIIPKKIDDSEHIDHLVYQLSIPKLESNRAFHIGFSRKAVSTSTDGIRASIKYIDDAGNVNYISLIDCDNSKGSWSWVSGSKTIPSGMTPVTLYISSLGKTYGMRITNVTLSYDSPIVLAMSEMTATKGYRAMILKGKIKRIKISGMLKKDIF